MSLMWCSDINCIYHVHYHLIQPDQYHNFKEECREKGCEKDHYYEVDYQIQNRPSFQPPPHGQVAEEDTRRSKASQEPEEEAGFDLGRSRMDKGWVEVPAGTIRNMRQFETGATRDSDEDKLDFEGFLSPLVLERYAQYMHEHRKQRDGQLRDSDNWQKGMPKTAYAKSLIRHVLEFWKLRRTGADGSMALQNVLCAIMFNAMGYLFEDLVRKDGNDKT